MGRPYLFPIRSCTASPELLKILRQIWTRNDYTHIYAENFIIVIIGQFHLKLQPHNAPMEAQGGEEV
jgi:hypothetical protein